MKQTKTKYGKMKQIISNLKLPDYRYEQLTKAIFHQKIDNFDDTVLNGMLVGADAIDITDDVMAELTNEQMQNNNGK